MAYEDLDGNTAERALNEVHLTDDGPMAHPHNILTDADTLEAMSPDEHLNVNMNTIGHLMELEHPLHAASVMYKCVSHVTEVTHYETRALNRPTRTCSP